MIMHFDCFKVCELKYIIISELQLHIELASDAFSLGITRKALKKRKIGRNQCQSSQKPVTIYCFVVW